MKKRIITIILVILLVFSLVSCQAENYYRTGMDFYISHGENCSQHGVTRFVYSPEFVERYEYIDANFHYFESKVFRTVLPVIWVNKHGGYELALLYIHYTDEVYEIAKADLLDNTKYLSESPIYSYNGYDFYRLTIYSDDNSNYILHAFDDQNKRVVLLGFYACGKLENGKRQPLGELPDESEWGEYLEKYYGEFYDFNA